MEQLGRHILLISCMAIRFLPDQLTSMIVYPDSIALEGHDDSQRPLFAVFTLQVSF